MNKKWLMIFGFALVFIFFLSSFVLAANETTDSDKLNDAYECLRNQIQDKQLSLKESTFSILALGSEGNLIDQVELMKDSDSCWPKGGCTLKETAQVALAYNRIGKDTSQIKKWFLSHNGTSSDLKWLLQIDITNKLASDCTINDGTRDNKIRVLENSKIQGSTGNCLSIDTSGYMLRVNPSCLDRDFKITCDQDFVSSILYQKTSGGTLFILPNTHSAASLGNTGETINGQCFRMGTSGCDYEGSLWAALALQKMGEDVSEFTPYLLALEDDNERFFPNAFLYIIVGGDDQYDSVIQQQKQGKFWEMAGTRDGRFYDTSLAMIALADSGSLESEATRDYLLSIQTNEGCWNNNNIRDTAFVLYAGWPKSAASLGSVNSPALCESNPPFSCGNIFECNQAGGIIESDYYCSGAGASCCSVTLQRPSCAEKQGLICSLGTECSGRIEASSDGSCCLSGACVAIESSSEDTCTAVGGTCSPTTCSSGEVVSTTETCSFSGENCCVPQKSSSLWIWIVLLIILIVLVVLGIIFRDKLKIWWYQLREKLSSRFGKKSSAQQNPPQRNQFAQMPRQQPMQRPFMQQRAPMKSLPRDREMEEALKRLRDMSKK